MPKVSPLESGDIGGMEPGLEPASPVQPASERAEKDSESNEKAADNSSGD